MNSQPPWFIEPFTSIGGLLILAAVCAFVTLLAVGVHRVFRR